MEPDPTFEAHKLCRELTETTQQIIIQVKLLYRINHGLRVVFDAACLFIERQDNESLNNLRKAIAMTIRGLDPLNPHAQ